MAQLLTEQTCQLWARLSWTSDRFSRGHREVQPLDIKAAPQRAGLYRMTWIGEEGWDLLSAEGLRVGASRRIDDPQLQFGELSPPVLLTIGRATRIRERLRQQFSTNSKHNRVVKRLASLLPDCDHYRLCDLALKNIVVEWVEVQSWIE